jgi:hypothetical protein
MFNWEGPYTESMISHASQLLQAEDLLRLKLQELDAREMIDTAAFIEKHRVSYFLAQSLALASPSESLKGRILQDLAGAS